MKTTKKRRTAKDIDDYIAAFPPEVQKVLREIRRAIARAVPEAEEKISYGIPAFALNGRVFSYFAGFKNHVSMYPAPRGVEEFRKALADYRGGKGTVQFPLEVKLPADLIERIAKFRAGEKRGKAKGGTKARSRAKAKAKAKSSTRAKSKTRAKAKGRAKRKTKAR